MTMRVFLAAFILFLPLVSEAQNNGTEFVFHGFNDYKNQLILDGASTIKPSGALRLTNSSLDVIGHAFYRHPVRMRDDTASSNASSFSTSFIFLIKPPNSGSGGHGIAFTLSPLPRFPGAEPGHFLGIFNSTNDGKDSNHVVAVEFDTVSGFNETRNGNHVGININSIRSKVAEPVAGPGSYDLYKLIKDEIWLESGDPIRAWIEYDGLNKLVNVTVSPLYKDKPRKPLISYAVDLTSIVTENMYVGFAASTAELASSQYILGWSFALNSVEAPPIDVSVLPMIPDENKSSSYDPSTIILISVFSSVAVLLAVSGLLVLYRRRTQDESLEEWELDCPHRFRYKDLYRATKGFRDSEIVGVGGFGVVYRGVLTSNDTELAVKKISRNSFQGLREFAAEIESLGRLRHKNLVNLQGWCKIKNDKKNDLLIVYEYIPNGSLDILLFKPPNGVVLSWEQRFNILRGIAAGLLYLHEEWEQVVIHRDVKSSNVLVDADMNGRLSDFGLARLYDHGGLSHTTNVVGTIGYIAPELARTGKPSTSSDVFAYGVLLLEVATGRRPIDSSTFILVDWVMECDQLGQILDVVDPQLETQYSVEEMELVLRLGLLCSHSKPEARPTMRQVTRILNGEDYITEIDYSDSMNGSWSRRMTSRHTEAVSSDIIGASYHSSSFRISSNSIEAGR